MARVRVWNRTNADIEDEEQDCPECAGRGDDGCLTCCGLGYV